ncbi:hypothetical protein JX265_006802 [Neoarthrinium moseri]|uniref:C2H2-type domain-containing protein n=1 Tax=Neoarthrinium moseri TaxID=1658444 RepID=A0A9Q0AP35_9PEZI|nr:hypothetical protein JX265_006802 [Neoarthrinium moseri]
MDANADAMDDLDSFLYESLTTGDFDNFEGFNENSADYWLGLPSDAADSAMPQQESEFPMASPFANNEQPMSTHGPSPPTVFPEPFQASASPPGLVMPDRGFSQGPSPVSQEGVVFDAYESGNIWQSPAAETKFTPDMMPLQPTYFDFKAEPGQDFSARPLGAASLGSAPNDNHYGHQALPNPAGGVLPLANYGVPHPGHAPAAYTLPPTTAAARGGGRSRSWAARDTPSQECYAVRVTPGIDYFGEQRHTAMTLKMGLQLSLEWLSAIPHGPARPARGQWEGWRAGGLGEVAADKSALWKPVAQQGCRVAILPGRPDGQTPPDGMPTQTSALPGPTAVRVNPRLKPSHMLAVTEQFTKKNIRDYSLDIIPFAPSAGHRGYQRRYTLGPRASRNERQRLDFLQVFAPNRPFNQQLPGFASKMEVVPYEPKPFHHSDGYAEIAGLGDHDGDDTGGVGVAFDQDMTDLATYNPSAAPGFPSPEPHHGLDLSTSPAASRAPATLPTPKEDNEIHMPQRSKAIPKPERQVRKNAQGMYDCTFEGCLEHPRSFHRRCEWSKHMDKHDRPYRCGADGCEKLPGFTYSGGLLRHEREVHGKHGGPKNPLNCPHVSCKRHSGKGFSRLENLNEHLRRVHTNSAAGGSGDELPEDAGGAIAGGERTSIPPPQLQIPLPTQAQTPVVLGEKRKHEDDEDDVQREIKRLHVANETLNRELQAQKESLERKFQQQLLEEKQRADARDAAQKQQMVAMMAEIQALRSEQQHQRQQITGIAPNAILEDPSASF